MAIASLILVIICLLMYADRHFTLSEYYKHHRKFPRARISTAFGTIKPGDIVLTVSAMPYTTFFTRGYFTHGCVVVRGAKDDRLYVSETRVETGGTVVRPLLAFLKSYAGTCYLISLNNPLDNRRDRLWHQSADPSDTAPYPNTWEHIGGALGFSMGTRHCFQQIIHVLCGTDLRPINGTPLEDEGYRTTAMDRLAGRPLTGGYCYHEPHELVYDLDAA